MVKFKSLIRLESFLGFCDWSVFTVLTVIHSMESTGVVSKSAPSLIYAFPYHWDVKHFKTDIPSWNDVVISVRKRSTKKQMIHTYFGV